VLLLFFLIGLSILVEKLLSIWTRLICLTLLLLSLILSESFIAAAAAAPVEQGDGLTEFEWVFSLMTVVLTLVLTTALNAVLPHLNTEATIEKLFSVGVHIILLLSLPCFDFNTFQVSVSVGNCVATSFQHCKSRVLI
jgi:hypothetical protein